MEDTQDLEPNVEPQQTDKEWMLFYELLRTDGKRRTKPEFASVMEPENAADGKPVWTVSRIE